ncbi:MAG: acyl-CoA dehydratase activase [Pseudomonadota bacterium]
MGSAAERLGLDMGSVAVHAVITGHDGAILWGRSVPTAGRPLAALGSLLAELRAEWGEVALPIGLTGSAAGLLKDRMPALEPSNELVAVTRGASRLAPHAAGIIEVGGHMSRWMAVEPGGVGEIKDFSLSELCAAGAGVFLDQQAGRLKLGIEELSLAAGGAGRGATVAGRCTVFAKSDMIHLQQKGTPVAEIAYGVCLALARNFQASVMRGRDVTPPVVLVGGGALNPGLLRAFRQILQLDERQLFTVAHARLAGALGAALLAPSAQASSLAALTAALAGEQHAERKLVRLPRLPDPGCADPGLEPFKAADQPLILGVDVGSVSTNLVLLSPEGELFDGLYLATRGKPLEVLEQGLRSLYERHGADLDIQGVATTGSGRHLAGEYLNADLVRNEITAQLRGAFQALPDVDTVLEIGGQDSKFISARDGHIVDFTMNKVCAAGTGSFLEEQAIRLGLDIIGEFADHALAATSPVDLGSRCTVFMDSELVHAMRQGASTEDLAAGLALSVARNYLEKVVEGRTIGQRVLFQGGTASNRAVVAAFRQLLGRPVVVHPQNRVSGAVGAALLLLDARAAGELPASTRYGGLKACQGQVEKSFECRHCSNRCQVTRFRAGDRVRFFGDVCERYSQQDDRRTGATATDHLLAERWRLLVEAAGIDPDAKPADPRKALGIPRASLGLHYLPLWTALARAAGREPVLSPPSSAQVLAAGQRRLQADTCLPVKVAYGHVQALLDMGIRDILVPSVNATPQRQAGENGPFVCSFTRHLPYMLRTALDAHFLVPELDLDQPPGKELRASGGLSSALGVDDDTLGRALAEGREALAAWERQLLKLGEELLATAGDRVLVVMGKPYNLADPYLNMDLGRQLARLGLPVLPMDCLPLASVQLPPQYDELVWAANRDYLRAALLIREDPRLFPVVLSSFGCGPDGFGVKHLEELLAGRPRLFLELDEHRAEAGFVTRLEAFSDEIDAHIRRARRRPEPAPVARREPEPPNGGRGRLLVPYFADHVWAYLGTLRRAGYDVELLPPPDEESRRMGEELGSGRECHPFTLLAGDLVRVIREKRYQPGDAYLFQGASNACLFSQYADGLRHVQRRLGAFDLRIDAPGPEQLQADIGISGGVTLYRGMMATEILMRQACRTRPYEVEPGSVDRLYAMVLRGLADATEHAEVLDYLPEALRLMRSVPVRDMPRKPLVGVAGDIYTRVNGFANGDLFHRLEALGCEVWPAPFSVDLFGFNLERFAREAARRWDLTTMFSRAFVAAVRDMEIRWESLHWPNDERFHEPSNQRVRELAAPYLGAEAGSLEILNIAKMADFAERGADGVLNAICFGCMVGGISAAILQKIRQDHGGLPMATIAYGGTGGSDGSARLEAFVHQVAAFHAKRQRALATRSPSARV